MSAETIQKNRVLVNDLADHMETLSKDSEEYDRAAANFVVLNNTLTQAEKVENERKQKEQERVQAIKQWEREQGLREAEAEARHTEFMINCVVNAAFRGVEDIFYVDYTERGFMMEETNSFASKMFAGIRNKIPWMKGK